MTPNLVYKPMLFDLTNAEDALVYDRLLKENKHLIIHDYIELMLIELVKTRNPSMSFSNEALKEKTLELLAGRQPETYGIWAFYPWLNRVVHILPEREFIELRTSRNKLKILSQEQEALHSKKIGVVGLSVGQSVAVTLALERCCGTLRLADFDILELSNMNRIRSGVHEIGELKVVNTAREILGIDPFLEVEIFPEGLHRGNMQAFFLENGPLDVVIDECDSLDIKLLLREYAKQLRIPVLMDTSDRGMLDIEMFDKEPERPILHGFVGDLKADELQNLTTEEKIPYILKIVGMETMSERMKVSMIEVEQSIKTWPQLASNVVLGGGITADVARRMLLNYGLQSGRYFVDLEELIPDARPEKNERPGVEAAPEPISFTYRPHRVFIGAFKKIQHSPSPQAIALDRKVLEELVRDATQAPSGGNMQAWIWHWSGRQLFLFLDAERTVKLVDYNALGTLTGLGAAAESLVLSAHAKGLHVGISQFPSESIPEWVATFEFFEQPQPHCESHAYNDLYPMLYLRQCNRKKSAEAIDPAKLEQISAFASKAGSTEFNLSILTDREKIAQLGHIAGVTDRLRFTDKALHTELVHEIRWSHEDAERTGDGIDIELIDLKPSEKAGFQLARQWPLMRMVASLEAGGRGIEKLTRELVQTDHAIGLITTTEITPRTYFNGGRFYQRLWLYCTKTGIDWHPMPAMLYAFLRREQGKGADMPLALQKEVEEQYAAFREVFPKHGNEGGIMLMRLVPAAELPLKSCRRAVNDVLHFD
ncbi:MAG TPA: Rv1355c family protein [Saprospiraceae bacterium]|nr:Rv1355c family protein [Saprospiraceae bacterium]